MSILGPVELAYFQLTEIGVQRFQAKQLGHLGPMEKQIMNELVKLGGTAEWDEIKFVGTVDSPSVALVAMKRLIDFGYVTSAGGGEPGPGGE